MNLQYKSADPVNSHTGSGYVTRVTLDQTDVGGTFAAGDYLVTASAEYSCSVAFKDLDDAVVLEVDSVVVGGHNLRVMTAGDFLSFFVVKRITLTAGNHMLRIRTRTTGGGESVSARNARILLYWNIQGLQYIEDDGITTIQGSGGGGVTLTNSDKLALMDWEMFPEAAMPMLPTTPLTQASLQHLIWDQSSLLAGSTMLVENLTKTMLSFIPTAGPHLVLASWEQRSGAGVDASDLAEDTTLLQRHDDSSPYQAYFTAGAALVRSLYPEGVTYRIRHSNRGGGSTAIRRARIAVLPCVPNTIMVNAVMTENPPPEAIVAAPGQLVAETMVGSPPMATQGYVVSFVQASPSVNAPTFDRIGVRHTVDGVQVGELTVSQSAGAPIRTSMPYASFSLLPLTINVGKSTESEVWLYRVGSDGVARLEYLTLSMLTIYWASPFSTLTRIPERSWPVWLVTLGVGD
jgi:hypothetical protein